MARFYTVASPAAFACRRVVFAHRRVGLDSSAPGIRIDIDYEFQLS